MTETDFSAFFFLSLVRLRKSVCSTTVTPVCVWLAAIREVLSQPSIFSPGPMERHRKVVLGNHRGIF